MLFKLLFIANDSDFYHHDFVKVYLNNNNNFNFDERKQNKIESDRHIKRIEREKARFTSCFE